MTGGRVLSSGEPELCVTKAALVLHNRVGACHLDLVTGKMEFFAGTARVPATTTAEPFAALGDREITPGVTLEKLTWRRDPAQTGEGCAIIVQRGLQWRVAVGERHFALRVGITDSRAPVTRLGMRFRAKFVDGLQQPQVLRVAYCGAHSQSDLSRSEVVPLKRGACLRSWWTTAVFAGESEAGCVLGFLAAHRFAGHVKISDELIEASHATENRQPTGRDVLWSEPIFFASADHVVDALFDYGNQVGLLNGRRGASSPLWGWGSWGHFHDAVTATVALSNAEELCRSDLRGTGRPLVHVDHGWEERFQSHRPAPTWRARREFGSELAPLGQKLRARGARLGAWVVPFAINSSGPLPQALRAAVLRDAEGQPRPAIGRECYSLDPTCPAGERWLRDLFGRLKHAGVTHYKLDFLRVLLATDPDDPRNGLGQPSPFQGGLTRAEAYRRGLEIIRDVVGSTAHLLACGAPLLPGAGLIDSMRIGSDITPEWETGRTGIRHCAENIRCNFFWHGRVWDNDADFLVLPRDPQLFRHWATAVAFSGGASLISADLPLLTLARRRQLRRYFPAIDAAPRPLDLRPGRKGVRIACTVGHGEETTHLIACFNRDSKSRTFAINAAEVGVPAGVECFAWDVVRARPLGVGGRRWNFCVGPRDAYVIAIRQLSARPQFAGSSGHLASEQVELASVRWHARKRTLRITRRSERAWPERLFFIVPRGFTLKRRRYTRFGQKSRLLTVDLRGILTRRIVLSFSSHESSRQNSAR